MNAAATMPAATHDFQAGFFVAGSAGGAGAGVTSPGAGMPGSGATGSSVGGSVTKGPPALADSGRGGSAPPGWNDGFSGWLGSGNVVLLVRARAPAGRDRAMMRAQLEKKPCAARERAETRRDAPRCAEMPGGSGGRLRIAASRTAGRDHDRRDAGREVPRRARDANESVPSHGLVLIAMMALHEPLGGVGVGEHGCLRSLLAAVTLTFGARVQSGFNAARIASNT
jgi:hypothetical protein